MTKNLYDNFRKKITKSVAYRENEKAVFHRDGMKLLKSLAIECGLQADFRSNKGGIAVSGEVTLHGDTVYIQLYQSITHPAPFQFLIRSCQGRKDYTGGVNYCHRSTDPLERLIALINNLK